jgi:cyclopropane fatty-acyl-phospholipid synthase-like methyltransferase
LQSRLAGATPIVPIAELLCEEAGLRAGQRVLDVACGSGNAVIASPAEAATYVLAVMFVPDQERATAELVRTCRPGATIALASWTRDGLDPAGRDAFRTSSST